MDCAKLRQDIEKIKHARDAFEAKYGNADNGSRRGEFINEQQKLIELSDDMLSEYLQDFIEQNPELRQWRITKEVKCADSDFDLISDAGFVTIPGTDKIVIATREHEEKNSLRICERDENGNWRINEEETSITGARLGLGRIKAIAATPDGKIMVGGRHGELRVCEYDEDDNWRISTRRILRDRFPKSAWSSVTEITPTSDGEAIIVRTDNDTLYVCEKIGDDWTVNSTVEAMDLAISGSPHIVTVSGGETLLFDLAEATADVYICEKDEYDDWVYKKYQFPDVRKLWRDTAICTSDGEIAISGNDRVCVFEKDASGQWQQSIQLEIPIGASDTTISTISALPNGEIVVSVGNGRIYICAKDSNGGWQVSPVIDEAPTNIHIATTEIRTQAPTPDGNIIMGVVDRYWGRGPGSQPKNRVLICEKPLSSVDDLKRNIDRIIAKGQA